MPAEKPFLTKSDFLNYQTCPGYAWVMRHQPELIGSPDEGTLRRMRDGWKVEQLAREILPAGTTIHAREIHEADQQTRAAIAAGENVLFQPTALSESGLVARADVLIRIEHGWHMIEIKSSTIDPVKPKNGSIKRHAPDVAFQTIAFRQAGIPVVQTSLLLLNKHFRRGGEIDPHQLLAIIDVTSEIEDVRASIQEQIEEALVDLLNAEQPAPCDCDRKTRSNRCGLFYHFHPQVPERDTIYNIATVRKDALLEALDRGVLMMVDWPDDIRLTERQRYQVEVARNGGEIFQPERLHGFLDDMPLPLWYLDYESCSSAIPRWDHCAPHQQLVFQYSLHRWEPGSAPEHYEYLEESNNHDPSERLLDHMAAHLGPTGSVVVWNKSFEQARNKEMAERFPRHADFLHHVNERMVDLADIVKYGWWENSAFQGSWSLKQVLPVAAPDLDYSELEIGEGGTASEKWMQAVLDNPSPFTDAERTGIMNALRIYCAQDTLAMHRIREHVLNAIPE